MSGTIQSANAGVATSIPSTALSTEIAGVKAPSAYSNAAPKIPRYTISPARRQTARQSAPLHERHEGEHPALSLVVGADDDDVVLDRHHEHERPDDQREHAQDVPGSHGDGVRSVKRLPHRIQRAGTDVPVDDTEGGEGEKREVTSSRLFGGAFHLSL